MVLDLAENMARTLRYIEDVEQFARLAQLKKTIEEVYPLMEETQNFILLFTNRSGMGMDYSQSEKNLKTYVSVPSQLSQGSFCT